MRPAAWIAFLLLSTSTLAAPPATVGYVGTAGTFQGLTGLQTLLSENQREGTDLSAEVRSGKLPLDGIQVLLLGSYASDLKVRATLQTNRAELAKWLAAGGVLVELAQQDSGYPRTDWLPGGLVVSRADPDFDPAVFLRRDHPLATTPNKLEPGGLDGWHYKNWGIAWEALTAWDGFESIIGCGPNNDHSALVEGQFGKGRVIVSVVAPDSMVAVGEGDTPKKARAYFQNLLNYLDLLVAGEGVELHPTPALGDIRGPRLGGVKVALLDQPDSSFGKLLGELGVKPVSISTDPPASGRADLLLIGAGRAEKLTEAQSVAVRALAESGGVVVELYQNLPARPAWLPADQRAARGGYPGDFIVPGPAEHPLFESPNPLTGGRRGAWREGATPLAQPPFGATLGWGIVARFGGKTSPPAVVERPVGKGRAILVAADPAPVAAQADLAGDNARAFLANLLQYAADAGQGKVAAVSAEPLPDRRQMWLGRQLDGSVMVPTDQLIRPAGTQVEFPGRPTDLALLPDGKTLVVVDRLHFRTIDLTTGELKVGVGSDGGHAFTGVAVAKDGSTVFTSSVKGLVQRWEFKPDGTVARGQALKVPGAKPAPAGLALSADEQTIYVCASRSNEVVALPSGEGEPRSLAVGIAPYAALRAGDKLYVTNWGGPRPKEGDRTEATSGSQVHVDARTIADQGSLSVIDLEGWQVTAEVPVGLLPSGMCSSADSRRLYVANANSDTVSVVETQTNQVVETILVKPHAALPFGSGVNAVCLSPDGQTLYAACGTNNAVAVIALGQPSRVLGFIPVGWYPGALALSADGKQLYVANVKGVGSLAQATRHNSHHHQGSVSLVPVPSVAELAELTQRTADNNRLQLALTGLEPPRPGIKPRALPARHGEPSLIKHVVYIIRENRTYDQILGDLKRGNGDPSLVHFGAEVTPNGHALAEEFVTLDNFYCSGVLSADGHQWTDEGYVTSYLEKSFGGFVRSYPYAGDDALAYAPSGFIWDNVLSHGGTIRCYGEMVQAKITALTAGHSASFKNVYDDFVDDGKLQHFEVRGSSKIAALQANLCETTIGFPGNVPDIYRAGEFIRELREFEAKGGFPSFSILLLPCDHTVGTRPGWPTPRAAVADNDLALGRIVDAVSHSKFWPETAIFVCQDDPQAGVDHVDGHRSPAFVISPYTPRGVVDSSNYTQVGMLKTIELLLGLPPLNQLDLAAEPMTGCFVDEPNLAPYECRPNQIALDELNPVRTALSGPALYWAEKSLEEDLDEVDEADEDTLNRILWHYCKGYDTPYPTWAAGARE